MSSSQKGVGGVKTPGNFKDGGITSTHPQNTPSSSPSPQPPCANVWTNGKNEPDGINRNQ